MSGSRDSPCLVVTKPAVLQEFRRLDAAPGALADLVKDDPELAENLIKRDQSMLQRRIAVYAVN